MTIALRKCRYESGFAANADDVAACQVLRHRAFFGTEGRDLDAFDDRCAHLMVHDLSSGGLVCTARLLRFQSGADAKMSYAAQYYDMKGIYGINAPVIEVGRFCTAPGAGSDVLRVAWGALTRLVDAEKTAFLFGCSSFEGTDPAQYTDAFDLLAARHLGPDNLRPAVKAAETQRFAGRVYDARVAIRMMPQLLKTYLAMGGWVSDHAVIDRQMGTLHVFTGLEVAAVPKVRAKALRALAGSGF